VVGTDLAVVVEGGCAEEDEITGQSFGHNISDSSTNLKKKHSR